MNKGLARQIIRNRGYGFRVKSCVMTIFFLFIVYCQSVEAEDDLRSRYNLTPLPPIPVSYKHLRAHETREDGGWGLGGWGKI